MNEKIIFVRTASGEDEVRNKTAKLSNDIKRALLMVDGTATVGEIMKRSSPSLRSMLGDMFTELARGGYIQDKGRISPPPRLVTPPVAPKKTANEVDELDFTAAYRAPTQAVLDAEAAKAEKSRLAAEVQAARLRAEQEAAQVKARADEAERARVAAELAREQAEARASAEAQAREEAVKAQAERLAHELAARAKAEQEAEEARVREQRHAAEAARKAEQAAEKMRVAAQEKAQLEAELVRLKLQAEAEARERAEAQEQARLEAIRVQDAARIKAEQLEEALRAESARLADELSKRVKAEHDAAEAASRAEAERHAKEIAEATQRARQQAIKAEADAVAEEKRRLEEEVAALKALAESEALARERASAEAVRAQEAARIEQELEAARVKTEQEAARVKSEAGHRETGDANLSLVRLNDEPAAEQENFFSELDKLTRAATGDSSQWVARGGATERRKIAAAVQGCDSRGGNNGVPVVERRTTTAAVLFFDIVGYTKQSDTRQIEWKQQFNQLVTLSLAPLDAGERIVLDTGDGAAIGFLQHPTDALEAAMHFRAALIANKHSDYPDLRVRIGIHLGPVSLVKDMNGQVNMLGDGINSAQRVMSFAGGDQVYVSRAYFEFVSSLSDEYKGLFHYRGVQQDKHGREHQVYELPGAEVQADETVQNSEPSEDAGGFNFEAFDTALAPLSETIHAQPVACQKTEAADRLLTEVAAISLEDVPVSVSEETVVQEAPPQYSEAESMQLARAQAKKWAEAESRAAACKEEQGVSRQLPVEKPVIKPRRKPLPWGKVVAGLAALVAILLFIVPMLLPTQNYRVSMEQMLSAKLRQPVHIGRLEGRILPAPHLTLGEVYVGEDKQIQLRQVGVNFAFSALYSSVRPIASLELDGVQVRGSALLPATDWLQQVAADPQYPVARVALSQGVLEADGLQQLGEVDGELKFDSAGKFSQALLNASGHKLALVLRAAPEQKIALSVTLHDSALPLFPNWVFEELTAAGQLGRDELRIVSLEGRIMGGTLSGDARINWRSGWRVQGSLAAKAIASQNINKLLAGDLDGTARFQMQAASLSKIADAALFNGSFVVSKGVLNGVDVVETARLHSRESLPGGRTHFDEMGGELAYFGGNYRFTSLKISSGVLKAGGSLMISGQDLSGALSADLAMRTGSVPLQLGGTISSPALHAVP